jgi:hypothetical protein
VDDGHWPIDAFDDLTTAPPCAPEHGALAQTSGARFVFTPRPGFTGKDAYLFKICATKGAQQGCSTIAFAATVRGKR